MATAVYTYTVHDLLTNNQICELPLDGVKYTKRLNDSGTLSGTFTVENRGEPTRKVKDPYDATMPCRRCIYVWRDEVPQWGGIIWTRLYDSKTRQVQIGCGDFWSYYDHRKILPVLTLPVNPTFDVAQKVLTSGTVDQNALARQLITWANAHTGGNIGIVLDSSLSLINANYTYRGYELRDVGAALRELTNVLNGQDIVFDVATTLDTQGRPRRLLVQGDPLLGQVGSPHVWEYDANMTDYKWPSDGTRFAARTFAAGEGMVEGTPIAVKEDTTLYTAWPLMEQEKAYSTVPDATTLQGHADADQLVARRPVVLAKLTVRGDRSPTVGEWGIGDDGRVVITDDFFPNGVDTSMRIVAAQITPPDDNTDEHVELIMGPLLDNVA